MPSIVIDSSYALACVMPDESRPAEMPVVLASSLIAPLIWPLEIASAMRNGLRRNRFDAPRAKSLCLLAEQLGIKLTAPADNDPLRFLESALAHGLTPYDALYIELALSRRCAIASRDVQILAAATALSLPTFR